MQKRVGLALFCFVCSAFATSYHMVPIGQYVASAKGANTLPDTNLNHYYLPVSGTASIDSKWDKNSSITTSHSKTTSSSSNVGFSLRVDYQNSNAELGAANSNFYVAVVGTDHSFQFSTPCEVTPGANIVYATSCVFEQSMIAPTGNSFTLYESANTFSSSNFEAQQAVQCTVSAPGVSYNSKDGTYTLSALPYELTVSSDRSTCSIIPGNIS